MKIKRPNVRVFVGDATRRWAHELDDLRERWQIKKEPPTEIEWMPALQFSASLDAVARPGLQEIKLRLLEIKKGIDKSLREMVKVPGFSQDILASSELADRFYEMKAAEGSVKVHLLAVHDAQHRRKANDKAERARHWDTQFIEVCHEKLSRDQFLELAAETNARLDAAGVP